jgi:MFS transporter, ACS family, tartrate transporter
MPGMFLTGPAAAAAIAWINSIGNLGGFFGPWYVGFMKDATGSYTGGLYGLALFGFAAAAITAFFLDIPTTTVVRVRTAEPDSPEHDRAEQKVQRA